MDIGPLQYIVIQFDGNHFTGEILPEVQSLQERGIVQIVDLLFIRKDVQGNVTTVEVSELADEEMAAYAGVEGSMLGLLSLDDAEEIGKGLPGNSSAALVLFEHTWAVELKQAVKQANGRLVADGLLSADAVEIVSAQMQAALNTAGKEQRSI